MPEKRTSHDAPRRLLSMRRKSGEEDFEPSGIDKSKPTNHTAIPEHEDSNKYVFMYMVIYTRHSLYMLILKPFSLIDPCAQILSKISLKIV